MSVQDAPLLPAWDGRPRLLAAVPRRRRHRAAVLASALLHGAAILAIVLNMRAREPGPQDMTPPGVAVVFEASPGGKPAVPNPGETPPQPGPPDEPARPASPAPPAPPAPPALPVPPPPVPAAPEPPAPPVPAPVEPAAPPPPAPVLPAPLPAPVPEPVPTSPPAQDVVPLPLPPVPPQAPPQPVPIAPPVPRPRLRIARPAPNPLARYGIPLAGSWNLGAPGRSQGHANKGALDLSPFRSDLASNDAPPAWLNSLGAWIDSHGHYPRAAAENGEQGDVTVAIVVDRYGRVRSVQLERRSGSVFLDMALQALFRGQQVPPFPGGEGPDETTVHVTMRYILVGG